MANSKYSGIKKIEYADTGTAFASPIEITPILDDSDGHVPESQKENLSDGRKVYAGTANKFSVKCLDLSKFAALETKMKADAGIDIRVTDMGGNVNTVVTGAIPIVSKPANAQSLKRNYFTLECEIAVV